MKLGHSPKFQRLHMYTLLTTWGRNWAYFRSTDSGFRDTGRFSKLIYLGIKLGLRPKFQKLHIHMYAFWKFHSYVPLSHVKESEKKFVKIHQEAHGPWRSLWDPTHTLSVYPRRSKLSLFSLHGQRFPRYGLTFKIPIFGQGIWLLAKVPEVAHTISSYRRG